MRQLASVTLALVLAVGLTSDAAADEPNLDGLLLPNLQMAPLDEWAIERSGERRLLRFTTIFVNVGDGPFELRGSRRSRTADEMTMQQAIRTEKGGFRLIPTTAIGRYAGDGHEHWHTREVTVYEMWLEERPAEVRRGAKIDFCFFDNDRTHPELVPEGTSEYYRHSWCGEPDVLANRVGISIGWGDRYGWDFVNQWIDITGLPGGTYMVRATVDQQNRFVETSNVDNCAWARIDIPGPADGGEVAVLESGADCGVAAALPVRTFPGVAQFAPARRLRLATGEHAGYLLNDVGTVLRERRYRLIWPLEVSVSAVARPIGQPGEWYYVASGVWAGHWLPASPGVSLQPPAPAAR